MRGAGCCGGAAAAGGLEGRCAAGGGCGATEALTDGAGGAGGVTTAGAGGAEGRGAAATGLAGATGLSTGGTIAGRGGAGEVTGDAAAVEGAGVGEAGFGGAGGATTGFAATGGAGGRAGGAATASFFWVMALSTSPGREIWDKSILVLISSSPRRGRAARAAGDCPSAEPRMWARTFSASWSSMELEWVFFSVTPTSGSASRMALLLTSSSLARSLIRTLLIRPFFSPRCA